MQYIFPFHIVLRSTIFWCQRIDLSYKLITGKKMNYPGKCFFCWDLHLSSPLQVMTNITKKRKCMYMESLYLSLSEYQDDLILLLNALKPAKVQCQAHTLTWQFIGWDQHNWLFLNALYLMCIDAIYLQSKFVIKTNLPCASTIPRPRWISL